MRRCKRKKKKQKKGGNVKNKIRDDVVNRPALDYLINIRMPYFTEETNWGWIVGVICGELQMGLRLNKILILDEIKIRKPVLRIMNIAWDVRK